MCSTGFFPDPTNQGKDNQGRVEDEEKDVQKRVHQLVRCQRAVPSRPVTRIRVVPLPCSRCASTLLTPRGSTDQPYAQGYPHTPLPCTSGHFLVTLQLSLL